MDDADDGDRDPLSAFHAELKGRIDRVYKSSAGRFPDHRKDHPWVTGYLGDPFAPVWFVAENPSLTQVEKVSSSVATEELQWTISRGDRLFREMLFRYGFKAGTSSNSPGGWRCYITDVIKSTARVREHNEQPAAARRATADAWAPVLAWELERGRPQIIVSVGEVARSLLRQLIEKGAIPDPIKEWDARFMHIPHYVYVMSRPDNRRKLPPGDPQRQEEYSRLFAEIAKARDGLSRTPA
jgi:hypothetical protein